jgi:acyl carrier protein
MVDVAVTERIRSFIQSQFPLARQRTFADNDSLLQAGIIDSLGILEVVTYIEKEFGVSVADEELLPENFGSVQNLTAFVYQKRNGINKVK